MFNYETFEKYLQTRFNVEHLITDERYLAGTCYLTDDGDINPTGDDYDVVDHGPTIEEEWIVQDLKQDKVYYFETEKGLLRRWKEIKSNARYDYDREKEKENVTVSN